MAEKTYLKPVDLPYTRLRFHLVTQHGDVERFLIQLEYNHRLVDTGPDEWGAVARFDHNPAAPDGHDVVEEGLHLDLLDSDGETYDVRRGFPDVPLQTCPTYCESYLLNKSMDLVMTYEKRNSITGGRYRP